MLLGLYMACLCLYFVLKVVYILLPDQKLMAEDDDDAGGVAGTHTTEPLPLPEEERARIAAEPPLRPYLGQKAMKVCSPRAPGSATCEPRAANGRQSRAIPGPVSAVFCIWRSTPDFFNFHFPQSITALSLSRLIRRLPRLSVSLVRQQETGKSWDLFYRRNTTNFYKNRHWLTREFPVLLQSEVVTADDAPPHRPVLLELGCGVGNAIFPLRASNPALFTYACDISRRAVEFVQVSGVSKWIWRELISATSSDTRRVLARELLGVRVRFVSAGELVGALAAADVRYCHVHLHVVGAGSAGVGCGCRQCGVGKFEFLVSVRLR